LAPNPPLISRTFAFFFSPNSFTGSEFKLPGENVKAVNDSLLFSVYLEGQDIKVMLKIENVTTMTGKAVYSAGEVPLTLTKVTDLEEPAKN